MAKEGAVKKVRVRKFQTSWLDEEDFKGWLAPHPTENKALCTFCNKTITCCKTKLVYHSQSVKHREEAYRHNTHNVENNEETDSHINKVKRAEIILSAFFAEHNVAFKIVDHLIPIFRHIFVDSKIALDLSLGRHKCKNIITKVIAKRETQKTIEELQQRKFSILIDESSDITDEKNMCVLARYVSPTTNKITTQLLDLVYLDATDCSANKLFEAFKELFRNMKIPVQNIVGVASDNAAVMTGCNNSFMSRLKLEVPNAVLLNCICHSSAIIASKACAKLPHSCENLIRGVASYVSGSAKRKSILTEFQEFFNVERNKILKLSSTRWLALHKCIVRLLKNWEVLKHFFIVAVVDDKSKSAEVILQQLNDDSVKAYLLFLKYSLNFFNTFNAFFQSRQTLIHTIFENSNRLIYDIAQNCLLPEALQDIVNINIDDPNIRLNVKDIYLGPDCECFLKTLPSECTRNIKSHCLEFYITALREMLKRLPHNDSFFRQLMFLQPKIALYHEGRNNITDLNVLATRLGFTDIDKLAIEWNLLPSTYNDEEKIELARLEIDNMWDKILKCTDINGVKIFPILELLVHSVLSFPHSNAESERIFSIVTDVKNKKRNRLANATISSICIVRSAFHAQKINCFQFKADNEHINLHCSQNLYDKS